MTLLFIGAQKIIILFVILIGIVFLIQKRKEQAKKEHTKKVIEDVFAGNKTNIVSIPTTCPHCKNPNTKKLQVCEWCGNEIY